MRHGDPIEITGEIDDSLQHGDSFLLGPGEDHRVIITSKAVKFTQAGVEETVVTVEPYTKPSTDSRVR